MTIINLPAESPVPPWANEGRFSSVTRTSDELSIVCEINLVPAELATTDRWVRLEVEGPLPCSLVGVLAALTKPLAEAGVSVFAIATHDTDHLLIRQHEEQFAQDALTETGHLVVGADPAHP